MPDALESSRRGANVAPLKLLLRVNLLTHWRRLKTVGERSRLLTAVISLFIGGYLVLAYVLFKKGLWFLSRFYGFGTILTERLIYLLFYRLGNGS